MRIVRRLLWSLVALALVGTAGFFVLSQAKTRDPQTGGSAVKAGFGGAFTLVGADSKPFSSQALSGKPYAIYFGFTRCGDICPTTLSRLVKLRREAGNDLSMRIVFVTIDPSHDGPKEVGQYASLFNAPIIGLTGSETQIENVKKKYGIFAEPVANAPMGKEMEHTATVLLFDRNGQFAAAISPDEPDADALAKIQSVLA